MLLPISLALGSLQESQKEFHTFLSCLKCIALGILNIQNTYTQYVLNSWVIKSTRVHSQSKPLFHELVVSCYSREQW